MTIEELLEKIKQQGAILEELKKQVEALPEDEKEVRTIPKYKDHFFSIDYENLETDEIIYNTLFDEHTSSIGNYFKSDDDAKMVIRAMQIEQSIRIRRIELNDGWEPDWGDADEVKYFISLEEIDCTKNDICVDNSYESECLPIFGYYQTYGITGQIIKEFEEELYWYFTEYYPNRDNMYVWGD